MLNKVLEYRPITLVKTSAMLLTLHDRGFKRLAVPIVIENLLPFYTLFH